MKKYKKLIIFSITFIYLNTFALIPLIPFSNAVNLSPSYLENYESFNLPSEYTIQRYPDQKLISVKLVSGVNKPGYYKIPQGTSLLSLISWSGGISENADATKVFISRKNKTKNKPIAIDIEKILRESNIQDPVLHSDDIVFIKKKQLLVSQNTLMITSLIASIMGIILTGIYIDKNSK